MSLNYKVIGKHIREVRQRNHLSQAMLSELVDKTPSYISYIPFDKKFRNSFNNIPVSSFDSRFTKSTIMIPDRLRRRICFAASYELALFQRTLYGR